MRIQLISVGNRMPDWVNTGYQEYAGRMPRECRLELREIPAVKRTRGADIARITATEGKRMLEAVAPGSHVVCLDVPGQQWSTEALAGSMDRWLNMGTDVALLIGGPEGLAEECRQAARESWSLSRLTFPHPLVRVIVAEQLYRAWTVLQNHPYHRQ